MRALRLVAAAVLLLGAAQAASHSTVTGLTVADGGNPNAPVMENYNKGRFLITHSVHGPSVCDTDTQQLDCDEAEDCTYIPPSGNVRKAKCPNEPLGVWHKHVTRTCMCVRHAPIPKCEGGQLFATCARACTPTCENEHPVCSNECVRRCACPAARPIWDPIAKACVERSTCAGEDDMQIQCHEDHQRLASDPEWNQKFGCGKTLDLGWWFEHGNSADGTVVREFARIDSTGHHMSVAEGKEACDMMGDQCQAFVFSDDTVRILSSVGTKSEMASPKGSDGLYYKPVCPTPLHPAQGVYEVIGGGEGAIATVVCGPGYSLVGSAKRTCQADGTWTGTAPFCEKNPCLDPPTVHHYGKVLLEHDDASDTPVATYSCDPGFELQGSVTLQCVDNAWQGTPPTCTLACDNTYPDPPQFGAILPSQHPASVASSSIDYGCQSGYRVKAGGSPHSVCTPGQDGAMPSWSTPDYVCVPVECPEPVTVAHASLSDNGPEFYGETGEVDYPVGRIAKYQCHQGYQMLGAQISTCEPNGKWSAVPICVQFFQCQHTSCSMHGHAVQLHLHSAPMTGKNMVVQHGSDTGHDAADKWMNHRCRFDKNANEGAGGCTCICWHEDHAHREQHLASGVMTNSPVSARYLASTGAFGV